jgi:hypothetical protein
MLEIFVLSGSTAWPSRVVGREAALEEKMEVENMGAPAELGVLGAMVGFGSGLVICLVAVRLRRARGVAVDDRQAD